MSYSSRRGLEELKSIEKQLPLFYSKINNLEKRQNELKSLLAEADAERDVVKDKDRDARALVKPPAVSRIAPPPKPPLQQPRPPVGMLSAPTAKTEPVKILDLLQKDKVMGILGEANGQLKVLNNVVTRAVGTVESILMIVDFLEKNGQDLQRLIEMARMFGVSSEGEGKSGGTGGGPFNPEMVSEMLKSPQFAQLVSQVLSNMKQPGEAPVEAAEVEQPEGAAGPVPRQGMFFGPPGWGPWGFMRREENQPE
ncbi:MAG: hypothetical protein HPY50_16520 [Firmicutes bacterium]|nr:hypothetical protein [Bacillota bacterium]